MIPERHLGAKDMCEISQTLLKIDIQGFVTCLLFICKNKQTITTNSQERSIPDASTAVLPSESTIMRGSTTIKLNIFPPFLADM